MYRRMLVVPVVAGRGPGRRGAGERRRPARPRRRPASTPRRRCPRWCRRRLTRLDGAIERLTEDVNEVDGVHAVKAGKVVRRQLAAAWRGARYYITHAPAPPAEDARRAGRAAACGCATCPRRCGAKITQDDEGPVIADPVTTAMAVFDAFHDDVEHGDRADRRRPRARCSTR